METVVDSSIIGMHLPCPDCGSHDALCQYSDGHSYCFSCNTYTKGDQREEVKGVVYPVESMMLDSVRARGLTKETCEKYGYYKKQIGDKWAQVACYFDDRGELIGQKVRFPNKEFIVKGKIGDRFYGQQIWAGGNGKKLIITEGEIDCLTVSQLNGNKYPVVSIPNGVSSAKHVFKSNLTWLNSFEQVIVMFDMDEAGRKAVKDVEGLLNPGKLYVAVLPLKDPNECLLAGRGKDVLAAVWSAKPYMPDGIINAKDTWDIVSQQEEEDEGVLFPWDIKLNDMTMGMRKGELLVLTAGTGVGKSTFVREVAYDMGVNKNLKVGMLMLEENVKRTVKGLMSIALEKRLYINRKGVSDEEFKAAFDKTAGSGHYILYEHFGSMEGDNLMEKIRYMAVAEKCDFIILDHVSIAVSGIEGDNERKLIDVLMTRMRSIVEETGVGIICISHLRRVPEQQSHEEGGATSLSQLRGSGAIAQLADTVIGLERNQQKDGKEKNILRVRVLKNRWTGETGIAGHLYYNKDRDRLETVYNLSDYIDDEDEEEGEAFVSF